MNYKAILCLFTLLFTASTHCGRGDFGGSFFGGFSGSLIGNAISQPRRSCGYYEQPVQTRVIEVHRPTCAHHSTYVEVPKPRKTEAQRRYKMERYKQELEAAEREQKLRDIQNRTDAQTKALQQKKDYILEEERLDLRKKELELQEKELTLRKTEAEIEKLKAENEQLKLKLK